MSEFKFGDKVDLTGGRWGIVISTWSTGEVDAIEPDGVRSRWSSADLKLHTPTPPPNTVPVRIAVAVVDAERWNAAGWHGADDGSYVDVATEGLDSAEPMRLSWITAHCPLPAQPETIEGSVADE